MYSVSYFGATTIPFAIDDSFVKAATKSCSLQLQVISYTFCNFSCFDAGNALTTDVIDKVEIKLLNETLLETRFPSELTLGIIPSADIVAQI